MRISTFDSLRPAPPETAALAYRLRHWPERLPDALRTAGVLQSLSMMCNRPVSWEWLHRRSNLRRSALQELLALLAARGELDVVDTSKFPMAA